MKDHFSELPRSELAQLLASAIRQENAVMLAQVATALSGRPQKASVRLSVQAWSALSELALNRAGSEERAGRARLRRERDAHMVSRPYVALSIEELNEEIRRAKKCTSASKLASIEKELESRGTAEALALLSTIWP